tara:strand:- start:23 stop:247 length:225 start_codon:yes stop_codon:yes gene_type:complete
MATALKSFLEGEFGSQITTEALVYGGDASGHSGAFEVTANGELIHSKLTMGHGKCQTDEELDSIIAEVQKRLAA